MKAKRQNRTLSVSATMLDGSGGHVNGIDATEMTQAAATPLEFL
jgi:hypothetical protein